MATKDRRIVPFLLVLAALGATGFFLATGNPFGSKPKALAPTLSPPNTKAGAEQLVIANAPTLLTPAVRSKFVDPLTGLLLDNDYAQCYPSTTASGWWACELDSLAHPRPGAWFSVSYTGIIREKGEQPLGYGWVPN